MSTEGGTTSVDRALALLRAFRPGDDTLSLAELANRTGLNKATILRLAVSLENAHFLIKQPAGGFRLGGGVLALAAIFRESMHLDREIRPRLAALASVTGESAGFYLIEGNQRSCLVRVEGGQAIRDAAPSAYSAPLAGDETATGLTLRGLPGRQVGNVAGPFVPVFTTGLREKETASMSSPVFGGGGIIIGALTLSGPAFRLTAEAAAELAAPLAKAAAQLSESFGWAGKGPN
jgi:DNA-binding IclR family transcriptional regulator